MELLKSLDIGKVAVWSRIVVDDLKSSVRHASAVFAYHRVFLNVLPFRLLVGVIVVDGIVVVDDFLLRN